MLLTRKILQLYLCLIALCTLDVLQAHPEPASAANIRIQENQIEIDVNILHLDFLHSLSMPFDSSKPHPATLLKDLLERYRQEMLSRITLLDEHGMALDFQVEFCFTEMIEAVDVSPEDLLKQGTFYALRCKPPNTDRPFGILHRLNSGDPAKPATLEVNVLNKTFTVLGEVLLNPGTILWIDPLAEALPLSTATAAEPRQPTRLKETSPVEAFLYIEATGVRLEYIVPFAVMQSFIELPRANPSFIEPEEQENLRTRIVPFLAQQHALTFDGSPGSAATIQVAYFMGGLDEVTEKPHRIPAYLSKLGIVHYYKLDKTPQTIQLRWNLLNGSIPHVRCHFISGENIISPLFRPAKRTHLWQNTELAKPAYAFLGQPVRTQPARYRIPILSILCALAPLGLWIYKRSTGYALLLLPGLALAMLSRSEGILNIESPSRHVAIFPERDEAVAIVNRLLENTYHAFALKDEREAYDALACCVEERLLADWYLEFKRGLDLKESTGTRSRVDALELQDLELLPYTQHPLAIDVKATWTVKGTVEHWGHLHTRTSRYRARFTLVPSDGYWKCADSQVLQEELLQIERSRRSVGTGASNDPA